MVRRDGASCDEVSASSCSCTCAPCCSCVLVSLALVLVLVAVGVAWVLQAGARVSLVALVPGHTAHLREGLVGGAGEVLRRHGPYQRLHSAGQRHQRGLDCGGGGGAGGGAGHRQGRTGVEDGWRRPGLPLHPQHGLHATQPGDDGPGRGWALNLQIKQTFSISQLNEGIKLQNQYSKIVNSTNNVYCLSLD